MSWKRIWLVLVCLIQLTYAQKSEDVAVIHTKYGKIVIAFYQKEAPNHVDNFKSLVLQGFYNGTIFHRIVPGFVIQGGDPFSKDSILTNDGAGGPGYTLPPEIKMPHIAGAIAAARKSKSLNSNGSQFYICLKPQPKLDGGYTVFGHVIEGMEVANQIAAGERNTPAVNAKKKFVLTGMPPDYPFDPVSMTITLDKRKK